MDPSREAKYSFTVHRAVTSVVVREVCGVFDEVGATRLQGGVEREHSSFAHAPVFDVGDYLEQPIGFHRASRPHTARPS